MLSASEANRRYFEAAYRTGIHGWGVEAPSEYAVASLDALTASIPGGTVLDIGCGEGRHAIAAAAMGFRVTAIDYEPLAIQRARWFAKAAGAKGITFRRASVFELPFKASAFDAVLDYGCLHHQRKRDWPTYQANILRALKPRGFYILSVFSPRFRLFRAGTQHWHVAQGAYRRCFTRQDLDDFLGGDFDIITMSEEKGDRGGFWHLLVQRI
ncbi:MAG TPA: class I SAM-dependent methyltransferase [Candidatus Hydrogenedentes bacterium]|nr:class I SAM-dependent methyltransferase [Candidatus Hydrogenedentota bacterium]HPG67741.1 class I SAM-dependent methyltransferase [Candidatus Hydrogenedentota bacterium]